MKKQGRRNGVQRYFCNGCAKSFQSKRRGLREAAHLWERYTFQRQTIRDLSAVVDHSPRQLRRILARVDAASPPRLPLGTEMVVVIDTTYFDTYGVMVFRSWTHKQNLLWRFVGEESNAEYLDGLQEIEAEHGYQIRAVVCDGKKWLCAQVSALGHPVQHCQFHMMKTVTRYLTRHPMLPAGIALRAIAMELTRTTHAPFIAQLDTWQETWATFLTARTVDPETGHWQYTHRRLRGAYYALRRTLPYLFTFEDHPELDIPKTTNTLDGTFSHLKQKIHVHRGLNTSTQQKMVSTILAGPNTTGPATRNVH